MACLTFSCHIEGIAKRPCKNMIRRHATWMLIHPRSATFVSGLCFNFGEVFDVAYDTLLRTLLGAFRASPAPRRGADGDGTPSLPFRSRGMRNWCSEVLPYFLGWCGRRWNAVPTAGSDRSVASPNGRAGARPSRCGRNKLRPSRGFGPVAGGSLPRDRVTKSRTRRYQRPNIPPFERQDGNSMPHSPALRKRDFGKLKFCAQGHRG